MKAILILILLLCTVNTVLLVLHMKKMHQFEGFDVDKLSKHVGPSGMSSNSIALNASGVPLYAIGPTGGFFMSPVGSYSGS